MSNIVKIIIKILLIVAISAAFACQATVASQIFDVSTTIHGTIINPASADCEFSLHHYPHDNINLGVDGKFMIASAETDVANLKDTVFSFNQFPHNNSIYLVGGNGSRNYHPGIITEDKSQRKNKYIHITNTYVMITGFVSTTMPRCRIG